MSSLEAIQHRLFARSIEHQMFKPVILLEALNLCVAKPVLPLSTDLKNAINNKGHFFPPETTMESMRAIVSSNEPQHDIFSTLSFNASSSWRVNVSKKTAPGIPDEIGKWKLLASEVQTSLLFFAVHQRIQKSLLRAVMHAYPGSLHILPDSIFVQIFGAMSSSCSSLIDDAMKRRADNILAAAKLPISDLVRLTLARHPGISSLRSLWKRISEKNLFSEDAFCFLHEGLEQPEIYINSSDNIMLNRIYHSLHRRPDLLEESIYSFVHIYARSPHSSTQWQSEVNSKARVKSFLTDLIDGQVKIDVEKLKPTQLAWYIRFSCENNAIRMSELNELLDLFQAHGYRSSLEPVTEKNRKCYMAFYMYQITHSLLLSSQGSLIGKLLPRFLCALIESSLVEITYYKNKISTGELYYIGCGKVRSLLPWSRQLQREMDRMKKPFSENVESVDVKDEKEHESPTSMSGDCIFADVQWRMIAHLLQIMLSITRTRQNSVLTENVEKKATELFNRFTPRCQAELRKIVSLVRGFSKSGSLRPLISMKRFYQFSYCIKGEGGEKQLLLKYIMYPQGEQENNLVLRVNSSKRDVEMCDLFLKCRFNLIINLSASLITALPPRGSFQSHSRSFPIQNSYFTAIEEIIEEIHRYGTLLSDVLGISFQLVNEQIRIRVSLMRLVKICFRIVKYLLKFIDLFPEVPKVSIEGILMHVPKDLRQKEIMEQALSKLRYPKQFFSDVHRNEDSEDWPYEENLDEVASYSNIEVGKLEESKKTSIVTTLNKQDVTPFLTLFLLKQAEKLQGSIQSSGKTLVYTIFRVIDVMCSVFKRSQQHLPQGVCFREKCDLKSAQIEVLGFLLELYPEKYALQFQQVHNELVELLCEKCN